MCIALLLAFAQPSAADTDVVEAVPAGFTDTPLATISGEIPTDLALTPDGRLLIALKNGAVRVHANGALQAGNALDLSPLICNEFERGLQSITVDPQFATNNFVYVYYTYDGGSGGPDCGGRSGIVNRVARYTLGSNNVLAGPTVIVNNIASPCGNHNGGDLHFGADGFLYVSTGDGGCQLSGANRNNARYLSLLNGKILRVDRDGNPPASNPFVNTAGSVVCNTSTANFNGGVCRETYAWGFRNPFRFAIAAGSNPTKLYANDVGQNTWEEISDVAAGGDYGWNCREGAHDFGCGINPLPANMIDPIYDYAHAGGLCSITGGAFVTSGGVWPAPQEGAYLFGDYCGNTIYRLVNNSGAWSRANFATPSGGNVVSLMFDEASDALYYTLSGGRIGRISYTAGANRPPMALADANPKSGSTPLVVNFSSAGSSDPDNDALTYGWAFGDGAGRSTQPSPSYTYTRTGIFTATLVVTDSKGLASAPARVTIFANNQPPQPKINFPLTSTRFVVGQVITLAGAATDAEDSDVSASLKWTVLLHHVPFALPINEHTHPFFNGTGASVTMPPAPAPEDLDAAPLSFLEIQLTATDSAGQSRTVTQTLQPNRVAITLNTSPAGLRLIADTTPITATATVTTWQGATLRLIAPALQWQPGGAFVSFAQWTDGASTTTREVIAPATAISHTAVFTPAANISSVYLPSVQR
jgi:glucose/arabinose dehydrogenase